MFTWTETPLTEIWRNLRYLKSAANVAALLEGRIKSRRPAVWPASAELLSRAYDISVCVRQADEYFGAAEVCGLATRPLLQYYGALSLAKATILANDRTTELTGFRYHGLGTRAPRAASRDDAGYPDQGLAAPPGWRIEDEFAVVKNGVFPSLCRAICDHAPEEDTVIRLRDLLRIIPDLSDLYVRHYGEPSHCLYLYTGAGRERASGRFEVFFEGRRGPRERVLQVFPEFGDGWEACERHEAPGYRSLEPLEKPPDFMAVVSGTVAGEFAIRPIAGGTHKSFSTLFAAMYIVSNVVRYKPALWMRELEGVASGSASVIEALSNAFRRRLPNDALEAIWNERFVYGSPGYFT